MFFFFNDTATTEIYTLSLHDALPIWRRRNEDAQSAGHIWQRLIQTPRHDMMGVRARHMCVLLDLSFRSEEHTSELQSQSNLVCRLLLEKKKYNHIHVHFLVILYTLQY